MTRMREKHSLRPQISSCWAAPARVPDHPLLIRQACHSPSLQPLNARICLRLYHHPLHGATATGTSQTPQGSPQESELPVPCSLRPASQQGFWNTTWNTAVPAESSTGPLVVQPLLTPPAPLLLPPILLLTAPHLPTTPMPLHPHKPSASCTERAALLSSSPIPVRASPTCPPAPVPSGELQWRRWSHSCQRSPGSLGKEACKESWALLGTFQRPRLIEEQLRNLSCHILIPGTQGFADVK